MRVLFLHQNFPAQFRHIALALHKDQNNDMRAITASTNDQPNYIPTLKYEFDPRSAGRAHPFAQSFSTSTARGIAAAKSMKELKDTGFTPDIVIGHPAWGETLFVKDIWPSTKLIIHAEYYYGAKDGDVGFDPEFLNDEPNNVQIRLRAKNATLLMAIQDADFGVAPTKWQGSRFPKNMQSKIAIIHEGINTDSISPNPSAIFKNTQNNLELNRSDEIITFVNRNLEPYRGYHIFMRALPAILAARPKARVVIVGGDAVSYGAASKTGRSWKDIFFDEVKDRLPLDRVHFTGKIAYSDFISLTQVSSAHVYLTYPFVLSWSLMEAMGAGTPIIASNTAPVREIIQHKKNGLLVDFFDVEALSNSVINILDRPQYMDDLCINARETIINSYDVTRICLPKWVQFLKIVLNQN